MNTKRKIFIAVLSGGIAVCSAAGISAIGLQTEAEQNSIAFEMLGASIRYETESDKQAGIRFGVKLDKESYDKYAVSGAEMGMVFVPESLNETAEDITLTTENAKTAVTFDADGSKWGAYKENGVKVDGYVQSIVYIWDIPAAHYNDKIKVAAYIRSADGNVIYSDTVTKCIDEVALGALDTESDATKKSQLQKYLDANEYTVNFYDGDTLMGETQSYKYGETASEPEFDKKQDDGSTVKVFEGWYTSETDGTKVEDLTVYKNTNLYARWSTYTINKNNFKSLLSKSQSIKIRWFIRWIFILF